MSSLLCQPSKASERPRKWSPKHATLTYSGTDRTPMSSSCTNRYHPLLLPTPSSSTISSHVASVEDRCVSRSSCENFGSSEPFCPICYQEFDVFDCCPLECSHVFHYECLEEHVKIQKKSTCPMCRRFSVMLNDIHLTDMLSRKDQAQTQAHPTWQTFNINIQFRNLFSLDAYYVAHRIVNVCDMVNFQFAQGSRHERPT